MSRRLLLALFFVIAPFVGTPRARAVDQCPVLPTGTATLNGSVTAADGGANVFAQVTASAEFPGFGRYTTTPTITDFFTGSFSLTVPAPGVYVVSAAPIDQVHAPELYDGVLTRAAATTFSVTDGQVVNNIDFTVVVGATLDGTVTIEGSGDPLEGVGVSVTRLGDLTAVGAALTDASGDYSVAGLAPGDYQVFFVPTTGDYAYEVYNDQGTFPGDPVSVTGSGATGIDAALAIGGRIEGRITGNADQPLSGVPVSATSGSYQFGGGLTDPDGNYSILVPTGSYTVFAVAPSGFVSEFFNDKLDVASADAVVVTSPQIASGIDMQLAASGHITGTVTDALTNSGIEAVTVTAYNDSDLPVASAVTGPTGAYNLSNNLPSGQYKVGFVGPDLSFDGIPGYLPAFYANKATLNAATPVSVTAPAITSGIDQELTPCGQATTTTLGATTTTVPATTTTIHGSTTTVPVSSTTSSTSLPATTTTTLEQQPICGDPAAPIGAAFAAAEVTLTPNGASPRSITASDALYILRAAVGSQTCALCVCDVNASNSITATDALVVLRRAVGQAIELTCPACG